MPFFGKRTNNNYGQNMDDLDGMAEKFTKPQDQQNPLGVDMPMLAETSNNDQFKAFIVGKNAPNGDLKPPTFKKIDDKYPTFTYQYESRYKHDYPVYNTQTSNDNVQLAIEKELNEQFMLYKPENLDEF